ncbi:hypothetical protein E2C01_062982 [Portunus trituberculatus]|uniref:Uncharacterized protein n=1 Tax=Portunus trituberculatus TaxID=210409 RepID=A0A5B7HF62_PORTR|nr:hypothetical protein [Portunus trituberculatus]
MGISRDSEHVHIYIISRRSAGLGAAHFWQRGFVYLVPVFCSQTRRGANRKRNFGANTCAPSHPGGRAPPNTTTSDTQISGHATLPSHLMCPTLRCGMCRGPPLEHRDPPTPQEAPRVAQAKFGPVEVF